jgi:hypothetical protein
MSLQDEIKRHINYTEDYMKRCDACLHSCEQDHPVLDREWVRMCGVASIVKFQVKNDGRCDKFERKS